MFLPLSIMLVGASPDNNKADMTQHIHIDRAVKQMNHKPKEELGRKLKKSRKQSEELESQKLRETLNERLSEINKIYNKSSELFNLFEEIERNIYDSKLKLLDFPAIQSAKEECEDNFINPIRNNLNGLTFLQSSRLKKLYDKPNWIDYLNSEKRLIEQSDLGELKKQLESYDYAIYGLHIYNKNGLKLLNGLINTFEDYLQGQLSSSYIWRDFYSSKLNELKEIRKSLNREATEISEEPEAAQIPEEGEIGRMPAAEGAPAAKLSEVIE